MYDEKQGFALFSYIKLNLNKIKIKIYFKNLYLFWKAYQLNTLVFT